MKLKLNDYWTKRLLQFPERGMGYQKVDVKLKSGELIKDVIVLNAEDLVLPEEYAKISIEDILDLIVEGGGG